AREESASVATQTTESKKGSKGPSGQKPEKEVGQKKPKKVQPSVEPPPSGEEGWTVVGRKKKPAKDGANRQQKPRKDLPQARGSGKGTEKGKKDARPPKRFAGRPKRCAIIVEVKPEKGLTYAEILRQVRSDEALKGVSDSIHRVRRTQKGELLLELNALSENDREGVERVLGGKWDKEAVSIKTLSQHHVLECRGLDEVTTAKELVDAIEDQAKVNIDPSCVRLRKAYGQTCSTVFKALLLSTRYFRSRYKNTFFFHTLHFDGTQYARYHGAP
uniref:Uncharacterized protein n=1 Tax=Anopheles maculatus TaxID=74869 RepID=A0A182TB05_9DIPT